MSPPSGDVLLSKPPKCLMLMESVDVCFEGFLTARKMPCVKLCLLDVFIA